MKFLSSIVLFLVSIISVAQDYPPKDCLIPIEKVNLRVSYDVESHYGASGTPYVKKDKMFSEIGRDVCHSYIEREWNNEVKYNLGYEKNGMRGTNAMQALYSNIGEVFIGYPRGKNTVIYSLDVLGTYKYEESMPKLKWTITDERFDTLDYRCTMATCTYAGREYRAWFIEDIPVSYGPWKLHGLPGLIIKAETVDGDYRFVLSGIDTEMNSSDICVWKRDFVKSSRKKVRKQERLLLTRPDAVLDQMGIGYTVVSYDGTPKKWRFIIHDNPIEKE